jgi:hypothetical protein
MGQILLCYICHEYDDLSKFLCHQKQGELEWDPCDMIPLVVRYIMDGAYLAILFVSSPLCMLVSVACAQWLTFIVEIRHHNCYSDVILFCFASSRSTRTMLEIVRLRGRWIYIVIVYSMSCKLVVTDVSQLQEKKKIAGSWHAK